MRTISRTNQFKRDYKRAARGQHRAVLDKLLVNLINHLMSDNPLPLYYRDHALAGNWSDYRDCHLKPDLLMIYQITDDVLTLVRLGSHSEFSL